ncbi:MAG TPA: dihydrolipoamide acetyltransferase family protein [Armatimonadota bacterium]|nr:dihydrolipoamide acetyltransferase family protein [Armatimonadota bacterium]
MATPIVVPDAGQTTDEMVLANWHVNVGDVVQIGDVLADIETDKAVAELESVAAGHVLAVLAEEGDTIRVGQTLLWIGQPGEGVPDPAAEAEETGARQAARTAEMVASAETGGLRATPAARTLARERQADLAAITGTGPNGCVVKRDVLAAAGPPPGGMVRPVAPLSDMRRAIGRRLQQSVREVPQFQVGIEVDMTLALAARQAQPAKVSINDVVVKACGDTLARFPAMNCQLDGDGVRYLDEANVGMAVRVDDGLVVPIVRCVDQLSLGELAARTRELIDSARAGRVPLGLRSALTVSNLGMYGIRWFTAIVNPPEAAIVAVGAIEDKLVLGPRGIMAVPTLALTLSVDHRLIDGALAARFLAAVKAQLEGA